METKTISELASACLADFKSFQQTVEELKASTSNEVWKENEDLQFVLDEIGNIGKEFETWCRNNYATEQYSQDTPWEEKILLESVLEKYAAEGHTPGISATGCKRLQELIPKLLTEFKSSIEECKSILKDKLPWHVQAGDVTYHSFKDRTNKLFSYFYRFSTFGEGHCRSREAVY